MLTKLKLALLIAAPLVAGATSYAVAQGDGPNRKELIQKFDQNGDGKLDAAERAQMKAAFEAKRAEHHKEMLARYDANKDGKLDAAERKVMRDAKVTARFQAMDNDGDGKLTLDEFKAGAGAKQGFHRHGRHGHGHHRAVMNGGSATAGGRA
jgi:Ca2+-binding EF-hand superfamily protein